jgi:hypothetical protein
MAKIKDTGKRTQFETGAVREIDETKGRCDLVYNYVWATMTSDDFYRHMEDFVRDGQRISIYRAIEVVVGNAFKGDYETAYLKLSEHYAQGAKKYEDRNMEKGIPWHSMVDSALRHYTKWRRGDDDEPHDRAVIWNLLTLLYMVDNKPELNDLPCKEDK